MSPIPKHGIFLNTKAAIHRLDQYKIARIQDSQDFKLLGLEDLLASQTSFASHSSYKSTPKNIVRFDSMSLRRQDSQVRQDRQVSQDKFERFINAIKAECFESLDLCAKKESCATDALEVSESDLNKLQKLKPQELLMSCLLGQQQSVLVEKCINKMIREEDPTVGDIVAAFSQNLRFYVRNERASYITSALIKMSSQAAHNLAEYSLHNITKLLRNNVAVKVLQTLAGVSTQFSNFFVSHYRKNFFQLKDSKTAGLLMNKAVLRTDDRASVLQLVEKTRREFLVNPWGVKELLRLLSSILKRCELEEIEGLVLAVIPHIGWLLDDKIGNYSVQELLQPKFARHRSAIDRELLGSPPGLMFTEKHRRVVLLVATEHASNEKLLADLVSGLCSDTPQLKRAISSRCSANILLLALASISSPQLYTRVSEATLQLRDSSATDRGATDEEARSVEWFFLKMSQLMDLREMRSE